MFQKQTKPQTWYSIQVTSTWCIQRMKEKNGNEAKSTTIILFGVLKQHEDLWKMNYAQLLVKAVKALSKSEQLAVLYLGFKRKVWLSSFIFYFCVILFPFHKTACLTTFLEDHADILFKIPIQYTKARWWFSQLTHCNS